jgi:hypothetical protein
VTTFNKITGANAGRLTLQTLRAGGVAQFWR